MAKHPVSKELLDRAPPHDAGCEMALLGSLMLDSTPMKRLRAFIQEEDFYFGAHQVIWRHMLKLNTACHDMKLLVASLKATGDYKRAGGREHLAKLTQSVAVAAHSEYYARVVKGHAIRRQLIGVALAIVQDCYSGEGSTPAIVEAACEKLEGVRATTNAAKEAIKGEK